MTNSRRIVRVACFSSSVLLACALMVSTGCACKGCKITSGTGAASCANQKGWPSNERDSLTHSFFGSTSRVTASGS